MELRETEVLSLELMLFDDIGCMYAGRCDLCPVGKVLNGDVCTEDRRKTIARLLLKQSQSKDSSESKGHCESIW